MAKNMTPLIKDELITKCVGIVAGFQFANQTWSPILFDKQNLYAEPVKDRAFPIYYGCIRDIAAEINHEDDKRKVFRSARAIDDKIFSGNIRQIYGFGIFPAELISRLTQDEQIFLELARNKLVHGYLDGETKDSRDYTVLVPPEQNKKPFQKINASREKKAQLISKFGNGDILAGANKLRSKYEASFCVYSRLIDSMLNFDAQELEQPMQKNHILFSGLRENYCKFKRMLDEA